jgi:3-oxo-5-alpha-steroid 4-dehydrogenase 1
MSEASIHLVLVLAVLGLGALTFISLLFITAPYGRHYRGAGWGPAIPSRAGWVIMESPAVVLFLVIYLQGQHARELAPLVLLCMWQLHYVHRTLVFPLRMRARGKVMPVLIAGLAIVFNCINAYINARWISHLGNYSAAWLGDPRFVAGALLFGLGLALNVHSDSLLFGLRKPGQTGYAIPRGGGFRYVSSPNYLGELLEWIGWALATWSLAGLAFAVYTAANLVPRALSHHRWYREQFSDYPAERKAIIPLVL